MRKNKRALAALATILFIFYLLTCASQRVYSTHHATAKSREDGHRSSSSFVKSRNSREHGLRREKNLPLSKSNSNSLSDEEVARAEETHRQPKGNEIDLSIAVEDDEDNDRDDSNSLSDNSWNTLLHEVWENMPGHEYAETMLGFHHDDNDEPGDEDDEKNDDGDVEGVTDKNKNELLEQSVEDDDDEHLNISLTSSSSSSSNAPIKVILDDLVIEDDRVKTQKQLVKHLNGKVYVDSRSKEIPEPIELSVAYLARGRYKNICVNQKEAKKNSVLKQSFLFRNGGSFKYGHMVMIGEAPKNSPWKWAATWQASNSFEGAFGQKIVISFADDPTGTWTQPMVIPIPVTPTTAAVWGPVWHFDSNTGVAWLFYAASTSCRKNAGHGKVKYAPGGDIQVIKSLDGIQWSAPKTILTQAAESNHLPKLVSNQLAVHEPTGHWVLPMWRESPHSNTCKPSVNRGARTSAGVLLSKDQGKSWSVVGSYRARGVRWLIEGTVAEVGDTKDLLLLHRSGENYLYKQISKDGGKSWSNAEKTSVPNPNSKVNLIRLESSKGAPTNLGGSLALAYNDATSGVRRKLSVALSSDGHKWSKLQLLEDSSPGLHFNYPTIAQDGCRLLVAYSVTRHGGRRAVTQSGIKLAIVNLPGKAERENEEVLAISMDAPKEEEGGGEEERDRDSSDDNEEESIREDDTNEKEAIDVIDVQ
jgi:hypothetical protein